VGAAGLIAPRTMGVGYDNIEETLSGTLAGRTLAVLVALKLASWAISLGSGTSGGTLAPLFTIGGGIGALLGSAVSAVAPGLGVDPRIGALVGMAAMFAGASRALLTSVVFAFETTRQPLGLLPLLGGCSAGFFISSLMMKSTIMTEKLARRGARVPSEYAADFLDRVLVRDMCLHAVTTLGARQTVDEVRRWLASGAPGSGHQGFPVVDGSGVLVGVVTRRDLLGTADASMTVRELVQRPPAVAFEDSSLREAADHMVSEGVGRLPVVSRREPRKVIGIVSRSDLLAAHARRLDAARRVDSQRSAALLPLRRRGSAARST
jgi:CBS domain-containing protein